MGRIIQGTIDQLNNSISKQKESLPVIIQTVETIKEVPVEKIVEIEKPIIQYIEKSIEVPVEVKSVEYVDKIVEVIKEIPIEIVKEVKVLDKELLQKEVSRLEDKIEILETFMSMPVEKYDDSDLYKKMKQLEKKNKLLIISMGLIAILALAGALF